MKTKQASRGNGFTIVEVLLVVAVIALMAGLTVSILGSTRDGVKNVKLRSDVETLNEAVQVYRANGGSMRGVTTVGEALEKLKRRADQASSKRLVGLRGTMLDPRYAAEMLEGSEVSGPAPRAIWDAGRLRFAYATSGEGAKRFFLKEDDCSGDPLEEARETALAYGTQSDWIWDYADAGLAMGAGVGGHGVSDPASFETYLPTASSGTVRLLPPLLSREGGLYSYFDFDLGVELSNPNPEGISRIYYTVDNSHWHVYAGGDVMVAADQTLTAYAVSLDASNYSDSEFEAAHYESTFTISGSAGGDFFDPEGSSSMVTNLAEGESGSYFSFGTASGTPDPSWLLFNGASFADVDADVSFLLGSIDYYNGTIVSGTQATSVGLSVDLGFDGGGESLVFDFSLDLISTPNLAGNTPEENADYVRLDDLYSGVPVELGGVSYNLVLEFGETSEGGFSTIDEFHVIEGQSASGNLYGRLVEVTEEEEEG